ncbi:DnaA ATPase domain-containing protein [Rhodococcus erythropolis]
MFDAFVITETNRLAHDAVLAVSEKPADMHSPLVIYEAHPAQETPILPVPSQQTRGDE